MPSGSRSGGGGSHFGSSSRSSGGGSHSSWGGGGSSWGGRHHHHGTHVHIHGRGGFWSPFIAFAIFFFVLAAAMFSMYGSIKEDKEFVQSDYAYYQKIITEAKSDTNKQITAQVKDVLYNENIGAWYITYQFEIDGKGFGYYSGDEHYTFCIYKEDPSVHDDPIGNGDPYDLYPIQNGEDFPIAVNTTNKNSTVRSVNMDYEHTTLENDFEYKKICNNLKSDIGVGIGALAISVSLIIIPIVITVKKNKKQKAEEVANSGNPAAAAGTITNIEKTQENKCEYCGCIIKAGDTTCKRCGAARKR